MKLNVIALHDTRCLNVEKKLFDLQKKFFNKKMTTNLSLNTRVADAVSTSVENLHTFIYMYSYRRSVHLCILDYLLLTRIGLPILKIVSKVFGK